MTSLTFTTRPHLRGWSHAIAALVAIVLCPIAIVFSDGFRFPVAVFAASTVGLFAISASYHRLAWGTRAHSFFKRLDHAMIYIAIASTYTPVALGALPAGPSRVVLFGVWIGATVGVLGQLFWPEAPRPLNVVLYAVVGWICLPWIHVLWANLGVAGFTLVAIGGVLHTLGAVVYALEWPNPSPRWFGFHEIFHLLVIAAVATHYVAVTVIVA